MTTVTIVQQVVRPGLRPQTQATTWRAVPTSTLFVQSGAGMAYVEYGPQSAAADAGGIVRLPLPSQDVCRPNTVQWIVESADGAAWRGPITSDMPAVVSVDDLTQLWGWTQTQLPGGLPANPDTGIQGPGSLRYADALAPYVLTGLAVTAGPGLTAAVSAGAAYGGDPAHADRDPKHTLAAPVTVPVPANLPAAYVDWAPARGASGLSISLAPSPTPGSIRLRQLSSSGTTVTLGPDLRAAALAFSVPVVLPAGSVVSPASLTGAGTMPLAALAGITHSQLDPAAGILDAQISGLAASKLTGLARQGSLLAGGPVSGGVAPPIELPLPAFPSIPATYLQYHTPHLTAGGQGAGFSGQRPLAWRGTYAGGTAYAAGDTVGSAGGAYVALTSSTGATPGTDATKWAALGPQAGGPGYLFGTDQALNVLDFGAVPDCGSNVITTTNGWTNPLFPAWSGVTTYATGARVASGSYLYQAVAPSTNVVPGTDATKWLVTAPQGAPANTAGTGAATENSAAFAAAWYVAGITGDQIYVPPVGGYWIGDQLVARLSTGSSSNVIRMFGIPGQSANSGSWLLLTYRDPTVSTIAPANAKIVARGSGRLIIEGLGISVGLANYGANVALTAPDTDFTPVALATGAPVLIRNCIASGNALANQAFDFTALQNWYYLGIAPHTDFLICGDPSDANWGGSNGGFHGYGAAIENCDLSSFRRVLYARGANAANDIFVTGNVVHDGAGNIDTPLGSLIDIEGWGNTITDNSLTLSVGGTGFRLAGQGNALHQNGLWDPKVVYTTLKGTPPATWLTAAAAAGSTGLASSGYVPGTQGLVAGGQPVLIESTPVASLHTALTANTSFTALVDVVAGSPASDAGWLSGGTFPRGGYIRIFDRSAAGQPTATQHELWWIGSISGAGPYTLTPNAPNGGSLFAQRPHAVGTLVHLYPTVATQPFVQGTSQVVVNNLGGTAPDGGTIIRPGCWLRTMDVLPNVSNGSVQTLPGYREEFSVTAVSAADANGNYTLTLNRPAMVTHTSMVAGQGTALTITVSGAVANSMTLTVSTAFALMRGTPITVGGTAVTIQSISGNVLTLSAPVTASNGAAVTAFVPTTIIEPWEESTIGVAGQPTAAAVWQLSTSLRPQALSIPLASGGANPVLSAQAIPQGTQLVVQGVAAATPGTAVVLPTDSTAVGVNEYFTAAAIDVAANTILTDHGALFSHGTSATNVAIGPFANSCAALVQNHWSGHRITTNTLLVANPLMRYADLPVLHTNGYEQGDRFVVQSYAPQNPTGQQTTLAGTTYTKGIRTFTFTSIPAAWAAGKIVAIGPANADGTLQWGKTDFLTIANSGISGNQVTFNVPPRTPTGGCWFPHAAADIAVTGPFVITTSALTNYQPGGTCWVGTPFVEENTAGANDIWLSSIVPAVAGISLASENGPLATGAGTSTIRPSLPGNRATMPETTEFPRGLILPRFGMTPNRGLLGGNGPWVASAEGFLGIDGPNRTVLVELGGSPQPIANSAGYPVVISGPSYGPALTVTNPTRSAAFPILALGTGPFDGRSPGAFAGAAAGTLLGGNAVSTIGDLINLGTTDGTAFTSRLRVDAGGIIRAGGIDGTLLPLGSPTIPGVFRTDNVSIISIGGVLSATGVPAGWNDLYLSTGITNNNGAAVENMHRNVGLSSSFTMTSGQVYYVPLQLKSAMVLTPASTIYVQLAAAVPASITLARLAICSQVGSTLTVIARSADLTAQIWNGAAGTANVMLAGMVSEDASGAPLGAGWTQTIPTNTTYWVALTITNTSGTMPNVAGPAQAIAGNAAAAGAPGLSPLVSRTLSGQTDIPAATALTSVNARQYWFAIFP